MSSQEPKEFLQKRKESTTTAIFQKFMVIFDMTCIVFVCGSLLGPLFLEPGKTIIVLKNKSKDKIFCYFNKEGLLSSCAAMLFPLYFLYLFSKCERLCKKKSYDWCSQLLALEYCNSPIFLLHMLEIRRK